MESATIHSRRSHRGLCTTVEGIKIHRKDCKNILSLRLAESERIVEVTWPSEHNADYIRGIHISGENRPGLLSDITHAISTTKIQISAL